MTDGMIEKMNESQLYDWIGMLTFCAYDMLLYLDTHPLDEDAAAYYHQCVALKKQANQRYRALAQNKKSCGGMTFSDEYSWSDGPLPWEGGAVCGSMRNA